MKWQNISLSVLDCLVSMFMLSNAEGAATLNAVDAEVKRTNTDFKESFMARDLHWYFIDHQGFPL